MTADSPNPLAAENARLRAALEAIAAIEAPTKADHIGGLKRARHIAKCTLAESTP